MNFFRLHSSFQPYTHFPLALRGINLIELTLIVCTAVLSLLVVSDINLPVSYVSVSLLITAAMYFYFGSIVFAGSRFKSLINGTLQEKTGIQFIIYSLIGGLGIGLTLGVYALHLSGISTSTELFLLSAIMQSISNVGLKYFGSKDGKAHWVSHLRLTAGTILAISFYLVL
ncbi:MAG: hypothetical protein HWE14_10270 [Flavobacteriia bacterium]|nr:hypothetical protein [Flavobacteriia bacterium]